MHVLGPVRHAELLLDALLVGVDRFGSDAELAADLGAVETPCRQDHNRAFAAAQSLEPCQRIMARGRWLRLLARERVADGRPEIHFA